jgi:serine/threonine-protein kinase
MSDHQPATVVGRYLLHRKIARGGMATIHIARLLGDVGFSRIVAAKRMHPELAEDAEFVTMFLDEARIASRVQHRNVVNVLDVVTLGEEVMLVQEYVHGAPLGVLLRAVYDSKSYVPVPVAAAIACQVLAGLHAAHETVDELGTPLQIVHRDVSPQNILIATDGTARLLDFGVAKAALSAHVTRKGTFKGKLGYSSPEQIRGEACRQSDIYSLGVVLWELIVGHRLHPLAQSDAELIAEIMGGKTPAVTDALAEERTFTGSYRWSQLEAIEPVIRKALDVNPRRRWETAQEMEDAIAAVVPVASPSDVAAWLRAVGKGFLEERERMIAEEEASWRRAAPTFARPSSSELARGSSSQLPPSPRQAPAPRAVTGSHAVALAATSPSLLRRVPSAIIGALLLTLVGTVAFLMRDLDATTPVAHTTPVVPAIEPLPAPVASPAAPAQRVVPEPLAPVAATAITTAEPATVAPPRVPLQKPVARARVTPRPAPPVSKPAPKPAVEADDCATPFYFEGSKKIFKAGCL